MPNLRALNFFKTSTGYLASMLLLLIVIISAALGLMILTRLGQTVFSSVLRGDERWNEIRNSLLVIGTSLGVPFIIWRTLLLARQTQIQQDEQYSEIFFKAVTLLGQDRSTNDGSNGSEAKNNADTRQRRKLSSPNLEARVGAVYAISRVSSVSEFYHWPAMETLLSYVKMNGSEPQDYLTAQDLATLAMFRKNGHHADFIALCRSQQHRIAAFVHELSYPREDIQAALNVIGGREGRPTIAVSRQLRRIDFRRSCLQRAGLRHARLGNARLQLIRALGVDFRDADLSHADLYLARLDGGFFEGTNLLGANLCGAVLAAADIGSDRDKFQRMLNLAFGDDWTVLPDNIERPDHWVKGDNDWQHVYGAWTIWRRQRHLSLAQMVY